VFWGGERCPRGWRQLIAQLRSANGLGAAHEKGRTKNRGVNGGVKKRCTQDRGKKDIESDSGDCQKVSG